MSSAPATATVAILGGGLAGLSAAYYLTASSHCPTAIHLHESCRRLGGWIRTESHPAAGFRFEKGPRTIRPSGPRGANTLRLIESLHLQDRLHPIGRTHPAATRRLLYVGQQLHPLPTTVAGLFRRQPPFSRPLIAAILHDLATGRSRQPLTDESIYAFAQRRFGPEVAELLVSSIVCGVCAGDAREISVRLLLDDVFRAEQRHGGVLRGVFFEWLGKKIAGSQGGSEEQPSELVSLAARERWALYSFRDGLEELPRRLADHLCAQGVHLHRNSQCQRVQFTADKAVQLQMADGSTQIAQHAISSLPSWQLAPLLAAQHPQLAAQLAAIRYCDVALVNLQYDGDHWLETPAFGFLVPPCEKSPILGVIYDSCCFPVPGKTVLTVMMGGAWFGERLGAKPGNRQLYEVAEQHVRRILGVEAKPETARVHVLRQCIPQYAVGHRERVAAMRAYIGAEGLPLSLCGAAYDGVGVNDVIWSARGVVEGLQTEG